MTSYNVQRIERDIEKYLPMIIQREVKDKLIKSITITGCNLTHDLSFCKVFFTSLNDLEKDKITKHVNDASAFIRTCLAKMMEIRNTPALKFVYDDSIAYAKNIEDKIKSLHEQGE